jgi:hypothetical protein
MSRPAKYNKRSPRDLEIEAALEAGRLRSLALSKALRASSLARVQGPDHAKRADDRTFFAGPVLRPGVEP